MHSVKLDIRSNSTSGAVHSNIIIDGKDVGVLYMTQPELNVLDNILKQGALSVNDTTYEQNDATEEEFEYDVFDD
jgi:hypothetical protein